MKFELVSSYGKSTFIRKLNDATEGKEVLSVKYSTAVDDHGIEYSALVWFK